MRPFNPRVEGFWPPGGTPLSPTTGRSVGPTPSSDLRGGRRDCMRMQTQEYETVQPAGRGILAAWWNAAIADDGSKRRPHTELGPPRRPPGLHEDADPGI